MRYPNEGSLYEECIYRIKLDWLIPLWPNRKNKSGWSFSGFSWNPLRGRWHALLFYETYNDANFVTGAHWRVVKITNHLFLRIQTNA